MTRCVDFYELWRERGNFCGAGRQTVRNVNNYMSLVGLLEDEYDIPREVTYVNFTENAARILFQTGNKTRLQSAMVCDIAEQLRQSTRVTLMDTIHIAQRARLYLDVLRREFKQDTGFDPELTCNAVRKKITVTEREKALIPDLDIAEPIEADDIAILETLSGIGEKRDICLACDKHDKCELMPAFCFKCPKLEGCETFWRLEYLHIKREDAADNALSVEDYKKLAEEYRIKNEAPL